MNAQRIISYLDHTLLNQAATEKDIIKVCEEIIRYPFASLCIRPCHVGFCAQYLNGRAAITSVAGFPFGTNNTHVKAFEAAAAVEAGASEIDMVLNIGALKDKRYDFCQNDIREVVKAAAGAKVKVIIETCLLTQDEKRAACDIIMNAGAHFVKTSTGFAGGGATVEDIALLRKCVGSEFGVKAAGGIRTLQDCINMIAAGANRIGTSSAVRIAEEALSQ